MRNKKGLYLSILLFIFEVIGISLSISINKTYNLKYYTNLSNLITLIFTICFFINYSINNKYFNALTKVFNVISTIGLTVTFIVVLLVLGPNKAINSGIDGYFSYFKDQGFFLHFACPILSISSFILNVKSEDFNNKIFYILTGLYPFIYGVIMILLVHFNKITPPYFFLNTHSIGVIKTFLFGLLFVLFTVVIQYVLLFINRHLNEKIA